MQPDMGSKQLEAGVTQQPLPSATYFTNQSSGAQTVVVQLQPGMGVLNLQALSIVGSYYIKRTGTTTREAYDASGNKLFSQKEATSGLTISLSVVDNSGGEFISAEVGMNHFHVLTNRVTLGKIEMGPKHGKSMIGSSSHGQGTIKLQPEHGNGSYPFCLIYCRSCYGSSLHKFVIFHNDQRIGEIKRDQADGRVSVSFPPTLDERVKALIVVGAFAVFNMYWRPALCCGCCC